MNIAEILEQQATALGARPAIVEPRRTVTFAELNREAASIAAELAEAGVQPGMRALVLCPMSIALYSAMIALFRVGVTAVFVDPSAGRQRLNACIARVRPDAFVGIPRAHLLRLFSSCIRAIPLKFTIGGLAPGATSLGGDADVQPSSPVRCEADTPAIITFTSGSTGEPKAAVRTHGFLVAQHRALASSLHLGAGEVDLTTLPIFLLGNLASGVTSVIPDADLRAPGSVDAEPIAAQIHAMQVMRTVASPAFLTRLVEHASREQMTFETFRRIYTGGAPVLPRLLDAIAAVAPNADVVAVYGSTEAEPIAEIARAKITLADRARMAAGGGLPAGRPVGSIELRILRDRWGTPLRHMSAEGFEASMLGRHETGEIVVAGEHVLTGYLDGQGEDETKITVESTTWHRTGDAGYLDDEGRLWLMGRCAAKAVDAGGTTYPFAVECAASEVVPNRCAFLVHRDRRVLVVEGDVNEQTRHRLLTTLAWARLDAIEPVDAIPLDKRHNAKVEYPALRRKLGP